MSFLKRLCVFLFFFLLNKLRYLEYLFSLLFLKQITLCIKISDTPMRPLLQELKALLLKQSDIINENSENGTAIINGLQSLLKIAEMRYKCCFAANCNHSKNLAQNKYSLNTTILDDGENQCCPLSPGNESISSDIENMEDDDSVSNESYFTADEQYDVSSVCLD